LRVKLSNDVAIRLIAKGGLFPDGTIIAGFASRQVTSEENNQVLRSILERHL
jgi:hypothetical protein